MKHLFTLCLCLASVFSMSAQSVSLFNVDASGFPTVKAQFFAFDAANKQQRPSKSELTITENGQPRTITSVTCPPDTIKSLSVCIMVDTYGYGLIKLAQAGTQRLINYLKPPKDEIAITMMNKGVQIHQDFTSDTAKASASVINIPGASGVDIQSMFYFPYSGGVPFISGRVSDKKVLILVSDLHCPNLNLDEARLYQDAAKNNISVYTVLLGTTDYSGLFKRVAEKTGGKVFESVSTETQITNIFQEIERIEHNIPCEITWSSGVSCPSAERLVELKWNSITAQSIYSGPSNSIAVLQVTPPFIALGGKQPQTLTDTTITLTAQNADFTISGINSTFGSIDFSFVNTNFPLTIPQNTTKTITLRFVPSDSSKQFTSFEISTDRCQAYMSASGGFNGKKLATPTLKLTKPNGGEEYVVGSDTLITWEGIAKSDTVELEYSIDNGTSWKSITTSANNLQFVWKNIPKPTSNQCKIRVKQNIPGGSSDNLGTLQYDLSGHTDYVHAVQWSPDGTKVATASSDDITIIWSATSGRNLFTLRGHTSNVYAVQWSPDGSKVVTVSYDNTAIIWSAATGTKLFTLNEHTAAILAVQWSPDGSKVATASDDYTAIIWSATTGTNLFTLSGHTGFVRDIQWSPDGSKVATASRDSTAIIWSANSGTKLFTLSGHSGRVGAVQWSPDGSKVVTASEDRTAIIWSATSGTKYFTLGGYASGISAVQWSPDGMKVATASHDKTATIWSATTGILLFTLSGHTSNVLAIQWSQDGLKVVTTGNDKTAIIWSATTGTKLFTLSGHTDWVNTVQWSPDGSKVATASNDKTSIIWSANTGTNLLTLSGHTSSVLAVQWSPDGSKVATASDATGDRTAIIWSATAGTKLIILDPSSSYVSDIQWSPDGTKIATASSNYTPIIWSAITGTKLFTLIGHSGDVNTVQWSPDGTKVASASKDKSAIIWSATTGTKLITLSVFADYVRTFQWSPDGSKVATVSDSTAIIWSAITGTKLFTLIGNTYYLYAVQWSPDGSKVATYGGDKTTIIWSATNGTKLLTLSGHVSSINSVQWSPDGTKIATASDDNTSIIWSTISGTKLITLYGITGSTSVNAVHWSPDGTKVATANSDKTAIIWSAINGTKLFTLKGHIRDVLAVQWSPDGTKVATVSWDKTAKIWFVENATEVLQEDQSDAVFSIIAPEPTLQNLSIDMGKVLVGQSKDSTVLGIVCNKGLAPLHVLGIDITSGDSSEFSIPRGAGEFYIDSNCRDVMFGFAPTKVGIWVAKATIRTTVGNFIDTITITGEGIAPALAIVNPFIDFGQTLVGRPKDSTKVVTIKNVGTSDLTITQTDYNAVNTTNFSTLSGGNSFTLNPNKEAIMDLRFLPNEAGRRSGILQFHYTGVGSPATVQLFGEGLYPSTTVKVQDISAEAGEKANLTLKLLKSSGMQVTGAPTDWYARIHYNKSILFNEQTSNVCPGTTDSCVLELMGVYNPKTEELISIPCITTLGNTDHSTIVIDTFYWKNSAIVTDVATQNGTITITGVCDDGGVRLFIPATNSTSLATRPNPVQDKLQIQYGLREPLTVTLELLMMTGQVVQTIVNNQSQGTGQYTLTSDLSLLGNGVYLLRLRTNKEMLTTRVDVVK